MKILILEDEQRNAMRLIRLLNDIDATFVIEGPFTSIKEAVEFSNQEKQQTSYLRISVLLTV